MNKKGILQVCFLIALAFCSVSIAEESSSSSLAVLVYCDGENQELADKLQPLVEAEVSLQWDGTLVEREKIDELLDEMKLTRSGLSEPDTQLQLGKMITMDCLLTVRVNKDSVKTTFTQFPSTTIIHEKEYTERLEPQSLSVNIVTNAIKAYREHNRDPLKPQISIGSFFNTGPFKQYFDFSKNISVQLREELVKDNSIVVTERLLPSDLLGEFELARSGITESIAKNLSAPSSDILLYGEFKAKPEQDLTKPAAELDFTLFVISPTGLCESKKVEFSCYSNEPEIPVEKAKQLIEQVSNEVKTKLASGQKRIFSQKEYEEFKRQAFRLMPNPPTEDDYYKSQIGEIEELEPAFHMLECAMLFKGDDIQLLVCTGMILYNLSNTQKYKSHVLEENYLRASMEYIEYVYLIENNQKIRNLYWSIIVKAGKKEPYPEYIQKIQHIWDTRNSENWTPEQIKDSLGKLLQYYTDTQQLCQICLEALDANKPADESISLHKNISNTLIAHFDEFKNNADTKTYLLEYSKSLLNKNNIYSKWFGYLLFMHIYAFGTTTEQEEPIPIEFIEYFRKALNLLSDLQYLHKSKFLKESNFLANYFPTYEKALKQYNIKDDSFTLKEKFVNDKLKAGLSGILFIPAKMLNSLLTYYWEQEEYSQGYELLNDYLKIQSTSSSERYFQERNRFFNAMQKKNNFDTNLFIKIEFDNETVNNVKKIIPFENGIFGTVEVKSAPKTKVFRLYFTENKAYIISGITGQIIDIVASGKYGGIATKKNGLYLFDTQNMNIKNFTPDNSGFPSEYVQSIRSIDNNFILTVRSKKLDTSQTYLFDPETSILNLVDRRSLYPGIQNEIMKERLTLIPEMTKEGITNVIIMNSEKKQLLTFESSLLPNINDYKLWQGNLIFATTNNLLISKSSSNIIKSLPNKENMIYYCLYPIADKLYIGTSEGLYYISAEKFNELAKQVEHMN